MKVIVVRHGETYGNVSRVVESRTHGRLTYYGMEQAQAAAYQLKDEPIDIVYCSNLQRCVDTALILADYHPLASLVPLHQLRERNLGDYEGKRWEEVPFEDYEGEYLHQRMPGGESWHDVERRVGVFLNELYAKHPGETVLLVTHAGPVKAIQSLLGGVPLRESIEQYVGNGSTYYFMMQAPTRMSTEIEAL